MLDLMPPAAIGLPGRSDQLGDRRLVNGREIPCPLLRELPADLPPELIAKLWEALRVGRCLTDVDADDLGAVLVLEFLEATDDAPADADDINLDAACTRLLDGLHDVAAGLGGVWRTVAPG